MAAKRSKNVAPNRQSRTPAAKHVRGAQNAAAEEPMFQPGTLAADMLGVVLAVVSVALLIALVVPSSAVLTVALRQGLSLAFGLGAFLAPVALFIFATTFFIEHDRPLSTRIALGLFLICLAILTLLSLALPGAEAAPRTVIAPAFVEQAGGYVGGFLAYWLLMLVGRAIATVMLCGIALAGIVVCGFSISHAISSLRENIHDLHEEHKQRQEARRSEAIINAAADQDLLEQEREGRLRSSKHTRDKVYATEDGAVLSAGMATGRAAEQQSLFDVELQPTTTYIGSRQTQVLHRNAKAQNLAQVQLDSEAATQGVTGVGSGAFEDAATKGGSGKLSLLRSNPLKNKLFGNKHTADAQALDQDDALVAAETQLLLSRQRNRRPDVLEASNALNKADAADAVTTTNGGTEQGTQTKDRASTTTKPSKRAATGSAKTSRKSQLSLTRPGDGAENYSLPPLDILRKNALSATTYAADEELAHTAERLQATFVEFNLSSQVTGWIAGPSVTTFKIATGKGERVSKIASLEDDIALALAAKSVRIFAPIPSTSLVGIEIPNEQPQPVFLSDVLPHATGGPLDCAFGRDSEGAPIVVDLAGLPHLLVAGTTGSGKSVLLNAIIMSMLMRSTPEQVRLIMVDPKRVEFTGYAGLPHLYVPVVTEPKQAASALQWGVTEMERRLKVFEHYKVRDIRTFNTNVDGDKYVELENPPKHMPYFVIVIDELADLMMVAGKEVESSIVRIAQLGRAAGIHLIVATQRPSADVVTGLIRANIDNRVALSVDNSMNSRIILDQKGAEQLLGKGDMLVKLRGKKPRRAQGCWVSDDEIEKTVTYIREQVHADYHEDILTAVVPQKPGAATIDSAKEDDPLIWEAARIVVDSQLGSTSGLQRALAVGYARAGRIMDMLEAKGVVGPANGSKPRDVLIDKTQLEELQQASALYEEV